MYEILFKLKGSLLLIFHKNLVSKNWSLLVNNYINLLILNIVTGVNAFIEITRDTTFEHCTWVQQYNLFIYGYIS